MAKLFVRNSHPFDDNNEKNLALLSALNRELFDADQIKIVNPYGGHIFDRVSYS